MKIFNIGTYFCLLASFAVFTGCLEREFTEEEGIMSVDTREIVVPADMYEGRNLVTDTIFVTSNRSWSAEFESEVDWVKMDTTGHQDMARISELTPLVFRFNDNETESERSVKVKLFCADGQKEITLRQEPISYRLELTSSTDGFGSIKSDGDTVRFSINSNTEWSLSLKSGSTVSVTFPVSSGKYSANSLEAVIAENEDLITKDAVIVVSSPNIKETKWLEIPVGQLEGFPYFRLTDTFDDPENPVIKAIDGLSGATLNIKTNSTWKVELVSAEGISNVSKYVYDVASKQWLASAGAAVAGDVVAAGDKTAKTISLSFSPTVTFGKEGSLVVKVTADGVSEQKTITINQTPCVRWWMGLLDTKYMWTAGASLGCTTSNPLTWGLNYPENATDTANGLPSSSGNRTHKGEVVNFETSSGIKFRVYTPYGLWRNSKTGLMFGRTVGTDLTYIEIPALEGVAPVKVVFTWRNTTTGTFDIKTFDKSETVLSDCQISGQGTQKEFVLENTKKNTAYAIFSTGATDLSVGDMIYYYE